MGLIQSIQDLLETTLAASATFRTFVDAANSSEASERIYHDFLPDPSDDAYTPEELADIRPCALIYTEPQNGYRYVRDAAGTNNWAASGRLVCVLYRDTPDGTNADVDVDFREIAGDIISDLVNLSEQGDYLASTGFSADGPFRTNQEDQNELGDVQAFQITIDWGVQT